MTEVGIKVPVDTSQVKAAKKDVEFLNKALQESEKHDLKPGGEGLEESSVLIQKVTEDIRRMKGLVSRGERQGGLLNKKQFQEAEVLSKKIGDNLGSYAEKVSKARSEMAALVKEKKELEKAPSGFESPAAFIKRQERVSHLGRQIEETRKSGQFDKRFEQIDKLSARERTASEDIGGFGRQGPGMPAMLKKFMGPAAIAMGAAAIYKFAAKSNEEFNRFNTPATALRMRGGQGIVSGTYGYSPMESLAIEDRLNQGAGFGGKNLTALTETAKRFSRKAGITDTGETTGYMTGIYQATGWKDKEYSKQLKDVREGAIANKQEGRIIEILHGNQQIMQMAARNMGGTAVTPSEASHLTNLQMSIEARGGMAGKGQSGIDFISRLNRGITGGGSDPGSQLLLHKALGGDEVNTVEEMWEYRKKMEKGIKDPENLKNILKLARKLWGEDKQGDLSALGKENLLANFGELSTNEMDILGSREFYESQMKDPKKALADRISTVDAQKRIKEKETMSGTTRLDKILAEEAKIGLKAGEKGSVAFDAARQLKVAALGASVGESHKGAGGGFSTDDIREIYEKQQEKRTAMVDLLDSIDKKLGPVPPPSPKEVATVSDS
ncbi:hypothetical protein KAR91_37310 [Candidatus Pacearchaeota archaeon]|nr:hypothetical protein [Candidatus Pacearchaeota archaeon]